MATRQDFTTRARDEMYAIYSAYQSLAKRIDDLSDEVSANGGAVGLYGAGGVDFPAQGDDFGYAAMVAAFTAIVSLVGGPTEAQKSAIIVCRR